MSTRLKNKLPQQNRWIENRNPNRRATFTRPQTTWFIATHKVLVVSRRNILDHLPSSSSPFNFVGATWFELTNDAGEPNAIPGRADEHSRFAGRTSL
jgi:hypothetical protein